MATGYQRITLDILSALKREDSFELCNRRKCFRSDVPDLLGVQVFDDMIYRGESGETEVGKPHDESLACSDVRRDVHLEICLRNHSPRSVDYLYRMFRRSEPDTPREGTKARISVQRLVELQTPIGPEK